MKAGDPEGLGGVEGETKPAPQGLRQRHHGSFSFGFSSHASTGDDRAEWTGCSLRAACPSEKTLEIEDVERIGEQWSNHSIPLM